MIITEQEQHEFEVATKCWICGEGNWDNKKRMKVRDHDHYTGKYRGAAHNNCNLRLRRATEIPVFFHNFTNYDNHLFVKVLGRSDREISVIARNDEKHISVTKKVITSSEVSENVTVGPEIILTKPTGKTKVLFDGMKKN